MPVSKEQIMRQARLVQARVEELRKEGLSDREIWEKLREEGYWSQAIIKVMRVSGRNLLTKSRPLEDREFVAKIETMRRDPHVPILAREIDDYAWWRRVCYGLGIQSFYRLSPLAGLTPEDQKDADLALAKLSRLQAEMFEKAEQALKIEAELQSARKELEEWRMFARTVEPMLDQIIEVCKYGGKARKG